MFLRLFPINVLILKLSNLSFEHYIWVLIPTFHAQYNSSKCKSWLPFKFSNRWKNTKHESVWF